MTTPRPLITGVLAAAVFFAAPCCGKCAYLESDHEKRPPAPERIIPPPPPRNEICHLVSRIRVGEPRTFKNVTIFPLRLSPPWGHLEYRTLDESLSRGYIEILEEKDPDVRSILVRNNSPHYVFLMAGESLAGGKQNRLVSEDVLLGPHGKPVRVPVYCIERGRWSPGKPQLGSGGFVAPSSMRKMAREKASQRAMWDAVGGLLRETDSQSPDEDLGSVFRNDRVGEELGAFRREIRIPLRETVGCVAVANGRIAASDIFTSPELFEKLWPKLLDSYVVDWIPRHERFDRWPAPPSEEEVRRFLDRVFRASFRERDAKDAGRIVEVAGPGIDGEGLVFRGEVVHVHLTPRWEARL